MRALLTKLSSQEWNVQGGTARASMAGKFLDLAVHPVTKSGKSIARCFAVETPSLSNGIFGEKRLAAKGIGKASFQWNVQ